MGGMSAKLYRVSSNERAHVCAYLVGARTRSSATNSSVRSQASSLRVASHVSVVPSIRLPTQVMTFWSKAPTAAATAPRASSQTLRPTTSVKSAPLGRSQSHWRHPRAPTSSALHAHQGPLETRLRWRSATNAPVVQSPATLARRSARNVSPGSLRMVRG